MSCTTGRRRGNGRETNRVYLEDQPVHRWYRFVLSFPPHLVRTYLDRFQIKPGQKVLDPFCGTGTTLVECKKLGIASVGLEANPMAAFASSTKLDWLPDPAGLIQHSRRVADRAFDLLEREGIEDTFTLTTQAHGNYTLRRLPDEQAALLLAHSISPLPLHKALLLLECLAECRDEKYYAHQLLALASTIVGSSSNLHFGPEVGVGPPKADAPVIQPWLDAVSAMAGDLRLAGGPGAEATVHLADARSPAGALPPNGVDAVITSPPYPNEKDYTRTTRLESVLLGFIKDRAALRALKQGLVRSNTRNVYQGDDDDRFVAQHPEIQRIAADIERRRLELGKTSGFERTYPRVAKLYFGGMARHLADLRTILRPGAQLAYVVGDQASYLRVMIRTGQMLAEVASSLGYEVVGLDLFRTRLATATGEELREEVLVLKWPGVTACPESEYAGANMPACGGSF